MEAEKEKRKVEEEGDRSRKQHDDVPRKQRKTPINIRSNPVSIEKEGDLLMDHRDQTGRKKNRKCAI